jgi:hypothetical protein
MLQALHNFIQSIIIVLPQVDTDEVMPLTDDIHFDTWAKEHLSKPVSPLRSMCEALKQTIYGEAFFRGRRLSARALIEHAGVGLGLCDLQGK